MTTLFDAIPCPHCGTLLEVAEFEWSDTHRAGELFAHPVDVAVKPRLNYMRTVGHLCARRRDGNFTKAARAKLLEHLENEPTTQMRLVSDR